MKFKKGLFLAVAATALLAACSTQGVQEGKAIKELEKVATSLNQETSYIQFEQSISSLDGNYHETNFVVREVAEKKDNKYSTGFRSQFYMATPYTVLTEGDLKESDFTQVIDFTDENKKVSYLALDPELGLIPQIEEAKSKKDTLLNKKDVLSVIKEAEKVETGKSSSGIGVYTGADYYFKSIPKKIKGLKKESRDIDGVAYDVFTGTLEADPEEMFLIYKKSKVEIWVESKTKRLHKEIYQDLDNYDKETGVGQTIFTYIYDKSILTDEFKLKDIDEKVQFIKEMFDDVDAKSEFLDKTKEEYIKKSGQNNSLIKGSDESEEVKDSE